MPATCQIYPLWITRFARCALAGKLVPVSATRFRELTSADLREVDRRDRLVEIRCREAATHGGDGDGFLLAIVRRDGRAVINACCHGGEGYEARWVLCKCGREHEIPLAQLQNLAEHASGARTRGRPLAVDVRGLQPAPAHF